jgi:uncharacterized protein YjbI with pentapeptide repeats
MKSIRNRYTDEILFNYEDPLYKADFRRAALRNANFHFDSSYTNRRGAELGGANFYRADLQGATFYSANCGAANFCEANLQGADLSSTRLINADFRDADLGKTDLRYADLTTADLRGADLRGARLNVVNLRGAKLDGIRPCEDSLTLVGWLLFQAAKDDFEKRSLAAGIIVSAASYWQSDICWYELKHIQHPAYAWVIETLAQMDGFNHALQKHGLII